MDPVRRALFLLLFASVIAAEPTHARALPAERPSLPATATARWVQRLAVTLRRATQTTPTVVRRTARELRLCRPAIPQVAVAHATFADHAFRLPPPR